MRQTCLFCGNALDHSDEHIIPVSLNGRLHSKNLICKNCNAFFGINLDPVLREALGAQLNFFGFDNAPSLILSDDNGRKYKLDKNGKIQSIKVTVEEIEQNGTKGITVSGQADQAMDAFIKKMVRTFGKEETIKAVMNRQFQVIEKHTVPDGFFSENPLVLTPKLLLAIEKIMVEYFAYCGLKTDIIKERLKYIFKLEVARANVKLCNFRQHIRKPSPHETSHLILIRSIPDTNQLIGYVELFNVICAYTIFDTNYQGPELNFVFHQDVVTGKRIDEAFDFHFQNNETEEPNFDFLVNDLMERAHDKEMRIMIDEHITIIIDNLNKEVVEGKISKQDFQRVFFERSTQLVAKLIVENPDSFTGLSEQNIKAGNFFRSIIYAQFQQEFEHFYSPIIGLNRKLDDDNRVWVLTKFHFVSLPPHEGKDRKKVYCYFISDKGGHEKEIPCYTVFRSMGLGFDTSAPWI